MSSKSSDMPKSHLTPRRSKNTHLRSHTLSLSPSLSLSHTHITHLVVVERREHVIQVFRHDDKPLDSASQQPQSNVARFEQHIKSHHLLTSHHVQHIFSPPPPPPLGA